MSPAQNMALTAVVEFAVCNILRVLRDLGLVFGLRVWLGLELSLALHLTE